MLGLLLGLLGAAAYVTGAINGNWADYGGLAIALAGVGIAVGAVLLGQIFRFTIGGAAMWAMLGAAIAAVAEFVQGNAGPGFAFVLNAGLLWGVQQVLARPGRSRMREPHPPSHLPHHDDRVRPSRDPVPAAIGNRSWRYVEDHLQPGEQKINLGFLYSERLGSSQHVSGVMYLTDRRVLWLYSPDGRDLTFGWAKPHDDVHFMPELTRPPGVRTLLPSDTTGFPDEITTFYATDTLGVPLAENLFRQIEDFALDR